MNSNEQYDASMNMNIAQDKVTAVGGAHNLTAGSQRTDVSATNRFHVVGDSNEQYDASMTMNVVKDKVTGVGGAHNLTAGSQRTEVNATNNFHVVGDSSEKYDKNMSINVSGNHNVMTGQNDTRTILGDKVTSIGGNSTMQTAGIDTFIANELINKVTNNFAGTIGNNRMVTIGNADILSAGSISTTVAGVLSETIGDHYDLTVNNLNLKGNLNITGDLNVSGFVQGNFIINGADTLINSAGGTSATPTNTWHQFPSTTNTVVHPNGLDLTFNGNSQFTVNRAGSFTFTAYTSFFGLPGSTYFTRININNTNFIYGNAVTIGTSNINGALDTNLNDIITLEYLNTNSSPNDLGLPIPGNPPQNFSSLTIVRLT
jgi:hypothetical protein